MIAFGIGINATVLTVTNAVLFKGFALVQRNDRLVYISAVAASLMRIFWIARLKVFKMVGVKPILASNFAPSDEADGAPLVGILNYGFLSGFRFPLYIRF